MYEEKHKISTKIQEIMNILWKRMFERHPAQAIKFSINCKREMFRAEIKIQVCEIRWFRANYLRVAHSMHVAPNRYSDRVHTLARKSTLRKHRSDVQRARQPFLTESGRGNPRQVLLAASESPLAICIVVDKREWTVYQRTNKIKIIEWYIYARWK